MRAVDTAAGPKSYIGCVNREWSKALYSGAEHGMEAVAQPSGNTTIRNNKLPKE